jgi:hypothetical protein
VFSELAGEHANCDRCLLPMRVRLKIALPIIGLVLFGAESYHSYRSQREIERTSSSYFWWSEIRLDSDPTKTPNLGATPCKDSQENCASWEFRDRWICPGLATQFLMASALPAFIIGGLAVSGLGKLGVSKVLTFMLVMPIVICAWYFLIGWLLDRWIRRRLKRRILTAG